MRHDDRIRRILAEGKARTQCVYCGREGQILEAGTWFCGDGCRRRVEEKRRQIRELSEQRKDLA